MTTPQVVLRSLLLDEQLGTDSLQELLADDTGARLSAYLCRTTPPSGDRLLAPTVAELRAAALQLAKQGYLHHSRGIRLSRLGGAVRSNQSTAKQANGSAGGGAPPSPSAFPALPSAARPRPVNPTAVTPTSSWATSLAAAAGPTPSNLVAPSPASLGGPQSAAPTPSGGGGGGKLQGAWAQGPLAAMSNKKQAALDERMRGRTPPVPPSHPGGMWAAGSPSASIGSTTSSAQPGGGGRGGGGRSKQQHATPSTAGAPQDGVAAAGGAGGCWGNGPPAGPGGRAGSAAVGAVAAGASPSITANGHQHPLKAVPGPPHHQHAAQQGQAAWQGNGHGNPQSQAAQAQGQAHCGIKRIVPMPVQQQQTQHQAAAVPCAWPSPSSAVGLGSGPAGPAASSPAVSASAMNAWGVPPVNTSKQQQRQTAQQRQQQQPPAAAAPMAAAKEPPGASEAATCDDAAEPDPCTPCSAIVSSNLGGGPDGLTTPTCTSVAATANNQLNDPITPAAQIVPAVSDGTLGQHGSVASVAAYRARYSSPPSVTSYPHCRPPVAPGQAGQDAATGRLPHVQESPAKSYSDAATAAGRAERAVAGPGRGDADPWVGPGSGPAAAPSSGLGPEWGPAHERLARLHAWVLCSGSVACLQDEVSELLYLLACPPEVLLAPAEADSGGNAAATAAASAAIAVAMGPGALPKDARGSLDWPLHVAVQYGCAVLSRCGSLLSGLGHRLLAAVATCAAARLAAPALAAAADAAAQRRERSLARSRAVDALGGQRLQLVGPMLQSGNDMASGKSRSQEQQRRVSNRERCRDMFFAVVRQAASLINRGGDSGGLQEHTPGPTAGGGGGGGRGSTTAQTPPPSTPGSTPASAFGPASGSASAAESLVPLRSQCLEVLQSLHPDNLPFFAELFTGCVLQAAATGESLVEGDLANLASRNPSKFQRLNQRMQQAPGQVLAQQASTPHQQYQQQQQSTPSGGRAARTPGGYADSVFGGGGGRTQHGGSTPGPSGYGGSSHRGGGGSGLPTGGGTYGGGGAGYGMMAAGSGGGAAGPGGGGAYGAEGGGGGGPQPRDTFGVSARCAATLQRLSYFPPPQRPYIFFLEATDSQSLVAAVSRHMAGLLQTMLCKALGVSSSVPGSSGAAAAAASMNGQLKGGGCSGIGPSPGAAVGPLGDHVVASGTLASYLAYLSVVHSAVRYGVALPQPLSLQLAGRSGGGAADDDTRSVLAPPSLPQQPLRLPRHPPLDVLQLLCVAEERDVLVHVVPCVAQYLYITTNGPRIAAGSAPEGGQPPAAAVGATDGCGEAGGASAVIDAAALQLPYLQAIAAWLRRLLASRALQPQQPAFCAAALCLRSAAEEALSHAAAAVAAAAAADGAATADAAEAAAVGPYGEAESEAKGTGSDGDVAEWDARLARSLQESDGLVDSRLLELCCPAIEAASRVLQRAAAAAAKLLQNHPSTGSGTGGAAAGAAAAAAAAGSPGSAGAEPRPLVPRRVPPASLVRLGSAGTGGAAAAAAIPESVAAVLSAPGPSTLQQALAQALLGQYSTGEHAVPMRDVVSYVTGVLAVNGAAAALELIVPQVASEHLGRMAEAVRPLLRERVRRWQEDAATAAAMAAAAMGVEQGPSAREEGGGGDTLLASAAATAAPPVLPISEAMTAAAPLAESATAAATAASLEAAMPAVRRQLRENALRSLQALLPGTVPEEAVSAAAVLAAQSAEVACLQRLVAHVPAAVRSHMDEQVKHVVREVVREVERQAAEARLGLVQPPPPPEAEAARGADAAAVGDGEGATTAHGGGGRSTEGASSGIATDAGAVGAVGAEAVGAVLDGCAEAAAVPDYRSQTAVGVGTTTANQDAGGAAGGAAAAAQVPPDGSGNPAGAGLDPAAADASLSAGAAAAVVGGEDGSEKETGGCGTAAAATVTAEDVKQAMVDREAAEAGLRLSDELVELARRPEAPMDEVVQRTARCVGRAVALRPPPSTAAAPAAAEWAKSSAAAAAAAAARRLYDVIRDGDLDASSLERLLVRCLRAACATATAGGAAAAAWGARPPLQAATAPAAASPPQAPAAVSAVTIAAAAEYDSGAAAFAFLAEVALGVVQRNADDAHSWADVVWQPLPPARFDEPDTDTEPECDPESESEANNTLLPPAAANESELGSGSTSAAALSFSADTSPGSGSGSGPGSGSGSGSAQRAAEAPGRCGGGAVCSSSSSPSSSSCLNPKLASPSSSTQNPLPPMLANLYHHLAAYARDVESYRLLHGLRLALQRVSMGHLTRLG